MFDLKNKIALVTGAKQGMGRADAMALAKQGAKVVVTDIDQAECQLVVDEIISQGGEAVAFKMDVSNKAEVDQVFNETIKQFGRLDILINNAGIYFPKTALELTEDDWDKTININLKGQFLCAQRAAKEMAKNKWGRIINIASVASGQVGIGIAGGAHYTASKGGKGVKTSPIPRPRAAPPNRQKGTSAPNCAPKRIRFSCVRFKSKS